MENYDTPPLNLSQLLFEYSKDGRVDDLSNLLKPYSKSVRKSYAECLFEGNKRV